MDIKKMAKHEYENLVKIRRDFHQHPEISGQEIRTSRRICEYLNEWGIEYEDGIAQTGVVGIIRGRGSGKTVALRADIDALPVKEETGLEYASVNEGVMHACGHDVHTAIVLGAGKLLKSIENKINGNIKLIFQPAEEAIGGAKRMIEEGCLKNPDVDYVLGLHVMPYIPAGKIELKYGKLNGNTGNVTINVSGKSGHAAYPDTSVDAIVTASYIITALQTMVSRNISPLNSVALSFGIISGGERSNIIADKVTIVGTLRCLDDETRNIAKDIIRRVSENTAKAFGGGAEVEFNDGYIALINNDVVMDVVADTAKKVVGINNIVYKEFPSLGGEDFSYFAEKSPGAFYHLGGGLGDCKNYAPLHSSAFIVDENCLKTGVEMQVRCVLRLLEV